MDDLRNVLARTFKGSGLSIQTDNPDIAAILQSRWRNSTIASYRLDLKRFVQWAESRAITEYPISPKTLGNYLAWLHKRGISVGTISRTLTVLRMLHHGIDDPTKSPYVVEIMRGIRASDTRPPKKAHPISIADLSAMCASLAAVGDGRALRDRALLAVGWCGALRPSEIVALNWQDITDVDQGVEILIHESKTTKGVGAEIIALPLLNIRHETICPVRALRAIKLSPLGIMPTNATPVFSATHKSGLFIYPHKRLIDRMVGRIVKKAASGAHLNIEPSGHSLRRGFATFAAHHGIEARVLMRHGRWKTASIMEGYVERAELWTKNPVLELLG